MKFKEFEKPEYFVNRELSWIKFDDRVLSEARDKSLPLFERLKFLSITSSNLDEFYMVRVASLKDQVHAGYKKTDIEGHQPADPRPGSCAVQYIKQVSGSCPGESRTSCDF